MTRKPNKRKGEPSSDITSTFEQALSTEEILNLGEEAARLLNEPIFQTAFEATIQNYQDDWIATLPKESQKREALYNKVQAAGDVAKDLAAMVQASQGINLDTIKQNEINPKFQ